MCKPRCIYAVVLLLLLGFPAAAQETVRIREITASIAEGPTREARRDAITRVLKASSIDYELQEVGEPGRNLTNIIATIPGQSAKTVLLGAHYDRVAQGNGVLDNGASCAVLLHLLEDLKARPAPLTVRIVFFDLEEVGLLGSKAYFTRTATEPKPSYAINLDVFGYGDSFFVTTQTPSGALTTKFQQVASDSALPVRIIPPGEYPGSDHLSMIQSGIETLGITLIDRSEVDAVLNMVRGGPNQAAPPRVLSIIHTARDTMDVLRLPEVTRGADTLERFVRALN